jgi:carbonic anhydrase/acetyltransferase-like protein (isoleucine patch superfamily)
VASRTVVDSVQRVGAPPPNLPQLTAALEALRARFAGAHFARYLDALPEVGADAYVAPTAVLIGRVRLGDAASVWPGCVLRADLNHIQIGARSNLQDGTVVHLGDRDPTVVGEDVVVGHRAVLHGCRIEAAVLVGIQATILDGAVIGRGSVIGAGSVVTAGTEVPPRSLVLGVPGRVVKTLSESAEEQHRQLALKYARLAHNHLSG